MSVRNPLPPIKLDDQGLAAILGFSPRTIILRAIHRPWLLPPRATGYDDELSRWRQDVIMQWFND